MQRNLKVERLYTLGDFKNIKFSDEITDIPENLALRKEVIDSLYLLLLVQIERQFNVYKRMLEKTGKNVSTEEVAAMLDDLRENTLNELKNLTDNGKE